MSAQNKTTRTMRGAAHCCRPIPSCPFFSASQRPSAESGTGSKSSQDEHTGTSVVPLCAGGVHPRRGERDSRPRAPRVHPAGCLDFPCPVKRGVACRSRVATMRFRHLHPSYDHTLGEVAGRGVSGSAYSPAAESPCGDPPAMPFVLLGRECVISSLAYLVSQPFLQSLLRSPCHMLRRNR